MTRSPDANPYAAPQAEVERDAAPSFDLGWAEDTRSRLLRHETNLRSHGGLILFVSLLLALPLVGWLVASVAGVGVALTGSDPRGPSVPLISAGLSLVSVAGIGVCAWAGFALRRLDRRAKIPASIWAGLSLLNVPLGTILGGHLLYLLHSKPGQEILTAEYQAVRRATPHIKPKSTVLAKLVLALLCLVLAGLVGTLAYTAGAP